jgi:hypothetical protein
LLRVLQVTLLLIVAAQAFRHLLVVLHVYIPPWLAMPP